MKYYLVAGEASGDLHASNLIRSIAARDSSAQFRCFGGDMMSAAGAVVVRHYRDLAYMGLWPVISHLGTILNGARQCFSDLAGWKPDAVILVDYPGFNLSLAKKVRKNLGIPVYYYISPKIWAWKTWRIRNIRRDVNELFSILPFEVDWFRKHKYEIRYVGNPTVDEICAYRKSGQTPIQTDDRKIVAILAGSRRHEIERNLPPMLEAIKDIEGIRPILACAPGIEPEFYDSVIGQSGVEKVFGNTFGLLESSYAALVTSGTATLETGVFEVPQVVCYRMPVPRLTAMIRPLLLKIPYVSLVNLVSGTEVVPELLAAGLTVENIRRQLLPLLSDTPQRRAQLEGYARMKEILGPAGAPERAAQQIIGLLQEK